MTAVPKRVASSSRESLARVADELRGREHTIWLALQRYRLHHVCDPTAYELFREMHARGEAFDVNSVRPRLTALKDRGLAETCGRRRCSVTGRTVHTWREKPTDSQVVERNETRIHRPDTDGASVTERPTRQSDLFEERSSR